MTQANLYATVDDFKNYMVARGQGTSVITDTTDDVVLADILAAVSRYIEDETGGRTFYPRYETRNHSIPWKQNDNSILFFDDDLLEMVTFTNGNGTDFTAAQYNLLSKNIEPKWAAKLVITSTVTWQSSTGNFEYILPVTAWWGYHNRYTQRGWLLAGTLGAAITDTTTLAFTMTAGHTLAAGQIIKIGTEMYNISTVVTNTITPIQRGDNGSTTATHLNGASVYIWQFQPEIKSITLQIAQSVRQKRTGQESAGRITVTQAGVVIRPEEVPPMAEKVLRAFSRLI